jgi:RNA polymerase-binding transcription factor DksA
MALDKKTLEELKVKLIDEKDRLESSLERIGTKKSEGDYQINYPEDIGDRSDENATEVEQYADNLGLERSLETQLNDVLDALRKMDEGTYGFDEQTGEPISVDRLRVYPAARCNIVEE